MTAAHPIRPLRSAGMPAAVAPDADGPVWLVAVTGAGPMQVLVAGALLAQPYLPVRVIVLDPELPAPYSVDGREPWPTAPHAAVLRRVLGDPRVELSFADGSPDVDALVHAAPAGTRDLPRGVFAGEHLPAGNGWVAPEPGHARELRAARSAVVAAPATAAVSLLRAARAGVAPRLRDTHLILDKAVLSHHAIAEALDQLLELDVNVVVDPDVVAAAQARGVGVLAELAQRFEPAHGAWLHITSGVEPVQLVGRERVEAVVLATVTPGGAGSELRTVRADLFVHGAGVTVLPDDTGARVVCAGTRAPGVPARYVTVADGRTTEDAARARKVVRRLVADALRGQVRRRDRPDTTRAAAAGAKVIALPARAPWLRAAGGSA
jgi:hypothetical protein